MVVETEEKNACCSEVVYSGLSALQELCVQLVDLVFLVGF